jgi:hypothetical protein
MLRSFTEKGKNTPKTGGKDNMYDLSPRITLSDEVQLLN